MLQGAYFVIKQIIMMIKSFACALDGIEAQLITIEINVNRGAKIYMVGLPDNAIKESHQRMAAALKNVGYKLPIKEITINLAPADIKKEGSAYDLTIAIGVLAATNQLAETKSIPDYIIMGELALDGNLRPIKGVLPIAMYAKKAGFKGIILPIENQNEASLVQGLDVLGASNIKDVIKHFNNEKLMLAHKYIPHKEEDTLLNNIDFSDVKGQENVKRALEIAAAGGHNIILIGPPGSGKSMLAKRMATILPPMTMSEAMDTTKIYSISGLLKNNFGLVNKRPFRSPHHTVSNVALVGGGSNPKPGEISLAHNGILFLDELPECKRSVLEVLRQPLEDREVTISRALKTVDFPAGFMLVAAMNPSPNGDFYNPNDPLADSKHNIQRYLSKLSGPLMDRIDLQIEVLPVTYDKLSEKESSESSYEVRKRVIEAREHQQNRYAKYKGVHCNAQLSTKQMNNYCILDKKGDKILKHAIEKLNLSARSYARIKKVSRTIADLDNSDKILSKHIAEAVQYRSLDRMTKLN